MENVTLCLLYINHILVQSTAMAFWNMCMSLEAMLPSEMSHASFYFVQPFPHTYLSIETMHYITILWPTHEISLHCNNHKAPPFLRFLGASNSTWKAKNIIQHES